MNRELMSSQLFRDDREKSPTAQGGAILHHSESAHIPPAWAVTQENTSLTLFPE